MSVRDASRRPGAFLKPSAYAQKLKDPRWQRKRLEVMARDDFKCVFCKDATRTLHVHHKKYVRGKEPWDYQDSDLITLCEDGGRQP